MFLERQVVVELQKILIFSAITIKILWIKGIERIEGKNEHLTFVTFVSKCDQ